MTPSSSFTEKVKDEKLLEANWDTVEQMAKEISKRVFDIHDSLELAKQLFLISLEDPKCSCGGNLRCVDCNPCMDCKGR